MEQNLETVFNTIMESNGLENFGSQHTIGFIIAMTSSALFGYMLKNLYELYFQDNEPQDGSLARSLVLLAPALTATFWMIQNSLVLSLGLLGSLSFVRFRTPIKRSEDIAFIVVLLATAISCAVGTYIIGFSLLIMLFLYSYGRNASLRRVAKKGKRFAIVTYNTKKTTSVSEISKLLQETKTEIDFVSSRTYDGITSFVFNVSGVSVEKHDEISKMLHVYDKDSHINIFYPNERLGA